MMQNAEGNVGGDGERRRLLLKVTVEVSAEKSDMILVRDGDEPAALAEEFCVRHGLQAALVQPLTMHIVDNLKKAAICTASNGHIGEKIGNGEHGSGVDKTEGPCSTPRTGLGASSSGPGSGATTPRVSSGPATPVRRMSTGSYSARPRTPNGHASGYAASIQSSRRPSDPRYGYVADASCGAASSRTPRPSSGARTARPPRTPGGSSAGWCDTGSTRTPSAPSRPAASRESGSATATPRAPAEEGSCFERLHQHATQRRLRLDRLRQQVARDVEEEASRTTVQMSPGSARSSSWRRSDSESLGERLYREAALRASKLKEKQQRLEQCRRQEEEKESTFHPQISASQRACQGIGRSMRDPEGKRMKKKIEAMREMKEKAILDECTFTPQVDRMSEVLMAQRIARMKITGNLYDALYEDALRRQERQLEVQQMMPPGVTFQPEIGSNHHRPPNDDTREDFVHRLAYSKSHSERWLSMQRQLQEESQNSRSTPEFHPQTGRGPLQERNKEGLPIGEFLYKVGQEKAMQSQAHVEQEEEREKFQCSSRKVIDGSEQLFEESKQRKYREIYEALTAQDPTGNLSAKTLVVDGLDPNLVEFLTPMIAYLEATNECLDLERFCAALDYQRAHSATPTAHLFVQKRSERLRQDQSEEAFTPRTDQRSNRIAARHRPRCAPLHEQLHREKEVWQSKRDEQRMLQEERELRECTFQPNSRRPRSAGASTGMRSPTLSGGTGAPPRRLSLPQQSPRGGSSQPTGVQQQLLQQRQQWQGMQCMPSTPVKTFDLTGATTPTTPTAAPVHEAANAASPADPAACGWNTAPTERGADAALFEVAPQQFGAPCLQQVAQAEAAVAHCRSMVARAKDAVAASSVRTLQP